MKIFRTGVCILRGGGYRGQILLLSMLLFPFISPWAYTPGKAGVCESSADLDNLAPGEWCEARAWDGSWNTHLDTVKPNPLPTNQSGFAVMPYSGGAYDTTHDRFYIWGGGHMDYSGNEVYVFSLSTFRWERRSEPSPNVGGTESSGYYPSADGSVTVDKQQPRSRHTYDTLEYIPALDRVCAFGAAAMYPSASGTLNVDCFDYDTRQWEQKVPTQGLGSSPISAHDPVTGHVWYHGQGNGKYLMEFDPAAGASGAWTPHGTIYTEDYFNAIHLTAAIDPVRRLMITIGRGAIYSWPLGAGSNIPLTRVSITGDTQIINPDAPGFEFDPAMDLFVAWAGGTDTYTLNTKTSPAVWTRRSTAASNVIDPGAARGNGTYGRFRRVPSKEVYLVVNAVDKNIFFYRATNAPPVNNTLPQRPRRLRVRIP